MYGRDETETEMMLFSPRRRARREAAGRLYAAAVKAARHEAFYIGCGVPDTLQGRFEMLTLSIFPLLHRLMHDPGDDPELARLVSEALVADMDAAFREMGVGDLTVPKRMKTLYRSFAGRIAAYEQALAEDDAALVAAISRNVFPAGGEDARAARLATWLKAAIMALREAHPAALQRGEVAFPAPLPPMHEEAGG